MSLTKIEIEDINWRENEFTITVYGYQKVIKLSKSAIGCIEDNIFLDIKERKCIEL